MNKMASDSRQSLSGTTARDTEIINEALEYFLDGTEEKIVKNETLVQHLASLQTQAENGGFVVGEFSRLCRIAMEKRMPAQISSRFLACLVPAQPVRGEDLCDLSIWALTKTNHSEKYTSVPALRVVQLCLEHDLVKERHHLQRIYELFIAAIKRQDLVETAAAILNCLTTSGDVDLRRVRLVRRALDLFGTRYNLNSLRWKYRQLRPDLDPSCIASSPPSSRPTSKTAIHERFRKIYDSGFTAALADTGIGLDVGQMAGHVVYKARDRTNLLPSAETINLESGMDSQRNTNRHLLPITHCSSGAELNANIERLALPNNILSLLSCRAAGNILPRPDLVERFSFNLYHTLRNEFLEPPDQRLTRTVEERRQRRQTKLLTHLVRFQETCYQGLPVVGRFLAEYLVNWDGEAHFLLILQLVSLLQITDFQELYDTVIAPIETHYNNYSIFNQLLVLIHYFHLLQFWAGVEYSRFQEKKSGIFPDATSNCDSAFLTVQSLGTHIGEKALLTLSQVMSACDLEEAHLERMVLITALLSEYRVTQQQFVRRGVPVRLDLPGSLAHEALYSGSIHTISQVCDHILLQKKSVFPMLRQQSAHHETMGDTGMADLIRKQLSDDSLDSLENISHDLRVMFIPGNVRVRPGSLFQQRDWPLSGEIRLFLTHHPAFLPFILHHLSSLDMGDQQVVWANLGLDCSVNEEELNLQGMSSTGRLTSQQFYRNAAADTYKGPEFSDELVNLYRYLGTNVPAVDDFLSAFGSRRPPKPATSVLSQKTVLTESSGVSSFEPQAVKRKRMTVNNQNERENEQRAAKRVSPRQGEKRGTTTGLRTLRGHGKSGVLREKN